jgi:hypothetical protein
VRLKRKSVTLASLSIALLCAALGIQAVRVMAQQLRTVGVYVGDWAEYSVVYEGNYTGLNMAKMPVSIKLTVVGISGTNITCKTWGAFKNGSQETGAGSVDVESGIGNLTLFIIAADLNKGDSIYNGSVYSGFTINETITRNYLGSNVEVNHLNVTQHDTTSGISVNSSANYFWYRDSGLLAEEVTNETIMNTTSGVESWLYDHITVTAAVPEFPVSLILPLFVVLSTLVVVSAKKRLVKK